MRRKKGIGFLLAAVIGMTVLAAFRSGDEVTYHQDIKPIIDANCIVCHSENGAGPFPLTNYQEVSKKALTILDAINTNYMPPWMPDTSYTRMMNERYITADQKKLIRAWVDMGKLKGRTREESGQSTASEPNNWSEPDLILQTDTFHLAGDQTDYYHFFVLRNPLKENRIIKSIHVVPSNPSIVHHAWVLADTLGFGTSHVNLNVETEFSSLGYPFVDVLTGHLPGVGPYEYAPGIGKVLYANSTLVLQVHYYSPSMKFSDRVSIHLEFQEENEVQSRVKTVIVREDSLVTAPLHIPANRTAVEKLRRYMPDSVYIIRAAPHMHYLGKKVSVFAVNQQQDTIPIIRINNWDFNWQGYYALKDPILIPAGSFIYQEAWYDNTSRNITNPHNPPIDVYYGEGSLNEMCEFVFEYIQDPPVRGLNNN